MTTIAYNHKDKQVAVDSRFTRGDLIDTDKGDKVRKDNNGTWVFAGHSADYDALMILNAGDKVDIRPQCCALLIKDGYVLVIDTDEEGYRTQEILSANFTCGSGENFALAALDFGKTAKEAVNYAKTRDVYTGGRVRVFDVKHK